MNVNENAPVFGRGRSKGRQLKVVPIQGTLMGPPKRPAPKRKEGSTPAQTTSSSSNINWRSNQKSTQNNSTTVRTPSSSRSHSSTEPESRVVIALSEGRGEAVCEVGIAAINIARPSLILCQISDSQSYINTLTKINILNPSEILIPLTFIESFTSNRLINKVKEQFSDVKITGVTRTTFNKTTGLQYVKQLCVPSMNAILLILQHRYYALAAAAALLTYTETTLYVVYARESIKIEYQESEGSTIIDVATADRLELVASARPTMKKRFSCLLDVLNHCMTKIGSRTLRASILQPPCSVPEIEARLNCVTELVEYSNMLAAIQVVLSKLTNIDQLLTLATVLPDQAQSCSERQINYILLLNTVLEQIAPLRDIFENSTQPFFIEVSATLGNPAFAEIKDLVQTLIHTEAHPGKGQYGMFQRCFAIKSGINSLLDLVRKSYSERLDDMRKYVTSLGERYSLAFTLHNNHKNGYHIRLNLNAHQKKTLKKDDLPPECIQVERLANSYTMKTQDLVNLSSRVEDIMTEILKMSNIMIHKLLIQIREHVGIFYKLCEDVAKLDMLQSLAKASSAMQYVRPKFADYLEVKQARHPLLDFLCSTEPSANSMCASKEYNLNIITGPNGSGKSIFVRQVILLQVMAQVGCYVPAQSATLRVSDRILARVYLEDNMDCGASAFVLEMKEIQYFLTVLTNNTLIIIDELCRSTSVEEGTALAMAVCEKLMKTSAFLFFTTHFKFLTQLQDLHFNIKTWQLETLTETIEDQMVLRFTYNVIPGVTSLEHYGIFLAKGSWPEIIIKYAEEILATLSPSHKRPSPCIEQTSAAARLKYDLEADLQMLKTKKELSRIRINEKLKDYQRDLEGLGHHVEILLLSDQINDGNRLSLFGNDDSNCDTVHNDLIQTYPDYSLNQTGEFVDYFNLQGRGQYSNLNISQDISRVKDENEEIPQLFNFQSSFQEMEDSNPFYPENSRFPPPTQSCNGETYFRNNHKYQGPLTAIQEEYYGSFSDYSVGLNNSAISEQIARLQNAEMNFSYPNIFEPEVILETGELELSSATAQSKNFAFRTESTFVSQENIFMTSRHQNFAFPRSNENSVTSREFFISREGSLVSRENSIISRRDSILSNASIYEDAMSEHFGSENGFNNYLEPINIDESFLSITEQQFSLPLQQHVERTSTPITSHSQPLPLWNPTGTNLNNPWAPKSNELNRPNLEESDLNTSKVAQQASPFDGVNWGETSQGNDTTHGVSATSSNTKKLGTNQQPKSDSTRSDSIKWVAPNQNIFTTPYVFKTTKSSGAKSIINQASPQTANSIPSEDKYKHRSTAIIWNAEAKNACDMQKNVHNVNNSRYYSDADITEVLNDLQSCSEYFSDSQDWDFVDEEALEKTVDGVSKNATKVPILPWKGKGQNFQNHEEKKTHEEVGTTPVAITKFNFQKRKRNQLESSKNLDPHGNTCRHEKIVPKEYHKEASLKQDQESIHYGENNQEMTYPQHKTHIQSKIIEKPHQLHHGIKETRFDIEIHPPPCREVLNDLQSFSEYFSDSQDWDFVDEEALDKTVDGVSKNATKVSILPWKGKGLNFENHEEEKTHEEVGTTPIALTKFNFQKEKRNQVESSKNLDPHGNTCGKEKMVPKEYHKAASQKQDQESIHYGENNQETPYPQHKTHRQSKIIEKPHQLHHGIKETRCDIEIHPPPCREVLNDLQSFSEYFSDSQDWDFVDEEINSQLKQQAHDKTIDGISQNSMEVLEEGPNFQNQDEEIIHKEVRTIPVDLTKFDLSKKKRNQLESSKNLNTHGNKCGKKKIAPKRYHKEVSRKQDQESTCCGEDNQEMTHSQNKTHIQSKIIENPHQLHHGTKGTQFDIEIHEPPCREVLNDLQNVSEYFSDSQDWDFVDEEVSSKLNQEALDKAIAGISKNSMEVLEKGPNFQNQKEEIIHKEVRTTPVDLTKFGTDLRNNVDPHGYQCGDNTIALKKYHKEASQKQDQESIRYGEDNQEMPHPSDKTHIQTKSIEKPHELHHGTKDDMEIHEPPRREGTHQLEHHQRTSPLQSSLEIQQQDHNDQLHQFGTEIHEPPCREGTHQLEPVQGTSQLLSFPNIPQLNHNDEIHQFGIEIASHREGTHQLEHIQGTSQPQSFPEEPPQPPQLKFNEEIDQSNRKTHQSHCSKETTWSECNKESSQPQLERDPSSQMSWMQENGPLNNDETIPSGHNKIMECWENEGNDNSDPNLTLSSGSKDIPTSDQTKNKSLNRSTQNRHTYKQSQDQQIETKRNDHQMQRQRENDGCVRSQPSSLEPLGDIHLELFSDESIMDASQTQSKEENCPLSKQGNQCENNNPLTTENSAEIFPVESGNSKLPLDCNIAIPGPSKLTLIRGINLNITDDYETAQSGVVTSSQDSVFFATPCSTEPAFTSTPNDTKKRQLSQTGPTLSQNSKRKRFGYLAKNPNKPSLSPIQKIPNKPTIGKEAPLDIFEESQQEIRPLFKEAETSETPSDFESPKRTVKKPKWVPPLKTQTNREQKKLPKKANLRRSKIPKFKPPRKLTKREIELAFYEQDKKMLESGDSSQYLEQIINRPTVKQLQQIKHIASIHKTSGGVLVVPAKESKPKTRKQKFVVPLKNKSGDFDVTLFSDKNSNKFDQFMNNNNSKKVVNVRQDIAKQFIESEVVSKENACNKSTDENSSGKVCKNVQNYKVKILQNFSLVPPANISPKSEIVKPPKEGYYTQNKKHIDNIVDKYLMPEMEITTTANAAVTSKVQKIFSQEFDSSFFSQSTVVFD